MNPSSSRARAGERRALKVIPFLVLALAWALPASGQPADSRLAPTSAADAYYERGARALRQGDLGAALENLEKAAAAAPDDPTIQSAYARALLAADRPDEAAAVLKALKQRGIDIGADDVTDGIALYQTRDFEAARESLERATRDDPGNAVAHLYLGSTLIELDDLDGASRSLSEAERLDPSLAAQVEFRRGRIELLKGNEHAARGHFERVEELAPGSPMARAARQQLRLGGAAERPWSIYATVGIAYDSNLNIAGDDGQFSANETFTWRNFAEIGADYDVYEDDRFSLRVGATAFASTNYRDHDFDLITGRGWTVGAVKLHERVILDARYTYEHVLANNREFRRTHIGEPSLRIRPTDSTLVRLFYRYEHRDFFFTSLIPSFDRDGQIQGPGAELYYFLPDFTGWGSGFVRARYYHREETTDGQEYDSRGHRGTLLLGMPLPFDFFTLVEGAYGWRHYNNPSLIEPTNSRRRDRIRRLRVILRRPITDHITGELGYRYTNWGSNVDFYQYTRHIGQFLVTYRY